MKVAISTEGGNVATHFGRCPHYTMADIVDGSVTKQEVIPNPGHQPGFLPKYLAENGIECIVAGGMGPRAEGLFKERGIVTITGIRGSVDATLAKLAAGTLKSKDSLCEHE